MAGRGGSGRSIASAWKAPAATRAGLARWLRAHGQLVIEVDRPDRAARRRQGKADDLDAHAAARAVQAGTATSQPKAGDGTVEMLRWLRLARRSAVKPAPRPPTSSRRCW